VGDRKRPIKGALLAPRASFMESSHLTEPLSLARRGSGQNKRPSLDAVKKRLGNDLLPSSGAGSVALRDRPQAFYDMGGVGVAEAHKARRIQAARLVRFALALYNCSAACGKAQNFSLLAGNDALNVIGPQRQRSAHLALIARPVIDPCDARPVAALVIEHGLNNVRLHAEVGHASGDRPPYVVDSPAPYGVSKFLVEIGLGVPMRQPVG
jgi:hypothetical protein